MLELESDLNSVNPHPTLFVQLAPIYHHPHQRHGDPNHCDQKHFHSQSKYQYCYQNTNIASHKSLVKSHKSKNLGSVELLGPIVIGLKISHGAI